MIHSYKLFGTNIVVDVFSGSVHMVDDLAYDVIGLYKTHSREQIIAILTEKYAGKVTN